MLLDLNKPEFEPLKAEKLRIIEEFNPNYLEIVEVIELYETNIPLEVYEKDIKDRGTLDTHNEIRKMIGTDNVISVSEHIENGTIGVFVVNKKANESSYCTSRRVAVKDKVYIIFYK